MVRAFCAAAFAVLLASSASVGNVREVRYKDGAVKLTVEINEKNQPHGEYVSYHRSTGAVRTRGTYVSGKRRGLWIHADERGFICGYEDLDVQGTIHSVTVR